MTLQFQEHEAHPWFEVRDDVLCVGSVPVTEVALRAARTPFYVYDRSVMTRKVRLLRDALPGDIHIHYAVKANPMPEVVSHFLGMVDGLDVASGGELAVALAAGASPSGISFAGPGKSAPELRQAVEAGVTINAESARELRELARIGRQTGRRPLVALRVNPDFELKTSGMKMGGGSRQFGIDAEAVPAILAEFASMPLEFRGFHIFSGSQNLRPEAIIEAQDRTVELALRLADSAPGPVHMLNLGGGLGIPYFAGERSLDLAPIGRNLARLLPSIRGRMPAAEFIIELGRFLVGESGLYVCRVIDRKISRGQVFLVTDGGLHHHLAASGNFGQVLRKNYPVVVASRVRGSRRETASVVGPLCTPLDLLADRMDLAEAREGDLVAVLQSGAYGLTASPLGFLSHPRPAEILI